MKILYIGVHSNTGWGAEYWLAKAFKDLLNNNDSNFEDLTKIVGKSRSHISNTVRLLELDEQIL